MQIVMLAHEHQIQSILVIISQLV